ncbi:MAG: HEAT repeat domain-containing protein, partial [Candidatus Heimdallarchaeaceae archaeon]
MGKEEEEPMLEELLEQLKDEDEGIRIEAIENLGKLGDKRAIIPLYELFFRTQKSGYDSEVEEEEDSAISWVLWDSPERLVREDTVDYLVEGLESKREGVRISISAHLADQGWEWGEEWIIKPLLKALRDFSEEIRDNALEALVARENKMGGEKFLKLMESIEKEDEERGREVKEWRRRKIKRAIMNIKSLVETEPI